MRPNRCNDFDIKFMENVDNDKAGYIVSFKCKKCKKFGTISFDFDKKSGFNNDNEKGKTIVKTYKCCEAEVLINGILLYDDEEEKYIDENNHENNKSKAQNKNNQKLNDNKKADNNLRNNIIQNDKNFNNNQIMNNMLLMGNMNKRII